MNDDRWIVPVSLLALVCFLLGLVMGDKSSSYDWRECRTLLTTQDSTAVLAARPACAQWTWPPKEGTTR